MGQQPGVGVGLGAIGAALVFTLSGLGSRERVLSRGVTGSESPLARLLWGMG